MSRKRKYTDPDGPEYDGVSDIDKIIQSHKANIKEKLKKAMKQLNNSEDDEESETNIGTFAVVYDETKQKYSLNYNCHLCDKKLESTLSESHYWMVSNIARHWKSQCF